MIFSKFTDLKWYFSKVRGPKKMFPRIKNTETYMSWKKNWMHTVVYCYMFQRWIFFWNFIDYKCHEQYYDELDCFQYFLYKILHLSGPKWDVFILAHEFIQWRCLVNTALPYDPNSCKILCAILKQIPLLHSLNIHTTSRKLVTSLKLDIRKTYIL